MFSGTSPCQTPNSFNSCGSTLSGCASKSKFHSKRTTINRIFKYAKLQADQQRHEPLGRKNLNLLDPNALPRPNRERRPDLPVIRLELGLAEPALWNEFFRAPPVLRRAIGCEEGHGYPCLCISQLGMRLLASWF